MKNINKYVISLFILVIAVVGIFLISPSALNKQKSDNPTISPASAQISETKDSFAYKGKNDTDALTLLKERTEVMQDDSGLVTSINGREADSGAREYWSFYVNNEMANVGPADYITKDSDNIEWKIESY